MLACCAGMEMKPIESESLAAVGYDAARSILRLRFRAGGLYEYQAVPQSVWEGLLRAESKSRYFIAEIRGRFPCHRVAQNVT